MGRTDYGTGPSIAADHLFRLGCVGIDDGIAGSGDPSAAASVPAPLIED